MWMISFGFMGICSITDLIRKEIPCILLGIFTVAAGIYILLFQSHNVLLSIVPGCLLLLVSRVSGEAIGYGDGWMMINLGLLLGYQRVLMVIMTAVLFSSFCGMILLMLKKADRKSKMAFAPFLTAGLGIVYALQ